MYTKLCVLATQSDPARSLGDHEHRGRNSQSRPRMGRQVFSLVDAESVVCLNPWGIMLTDWVNK